jgi:predicted Zn-dependent protease
VDPRGAPQSGEALVERAIVTWARAADGRFALEKTADRNVAVVQVHFVSGDANYGETAPRIDGATGRIVAADVLIAANVAGDTLTQRIVFYLTALHELGHALGMPHTDDFDDIMYSFRRPDDGERYFGAYRRRLRGPDDIGSASATGLSAKDVAALRALYDR